MSLLNVHSSLRQTPFAIIDRQIYSSMLKLLLELIAQDPICRNHFLDKELLKEILRVRIAFDKKKQNLEEQIRNPTAFKEGHDLLKKLITILIEDQTLIYHCVEMEIFYFFTSHKNQKTLLNEFEDKFKPISSSFPNIF